MDEEITNWTQLYQQQEISMTTLTVELTRVRGRDREVRMSDRHLRLHMGSRRLCIGPRRESLQETEKDTQFWASTRDDLHVDEGRATTRSSSCRRTGLRA